MALRQMREIDIRTVDLETLIDAGKINIDIELPKPERMMKVVSQMDGNPYFFKSGNIAVKVSYADTAISFDERMESYLRTL